MLVLSSNTNGPFMPGEYTARIKPNRARQNINFMKVFEING